MGLMRFKVHEKHNLSPEQVARAYVVGHDRVPWPCQSKFVDQVVHLRRPVEDSGNFQIPWIVEGFGELMLTTATLREREQPYNLIVELARGKLNQVRNQIADWQAIGLSVPERLSSKVRESLQTFSQAATNQDKPELCLEMAEKALVAGLDAANLLASCYADQALAARHRQDPQLSTLLGASLGPSLLDEFTARQFKTSFNAAQIPFNWQQIEANEGVYNWDLSDQQIEWCQANKLAIAGGPLLNLEEQGLPAWLKLWTEDFATLMNFVSDFVETVVARYRGRVQIWECAGRANVSDVLGLSEEQRLRLTVRAIETVKQVDPDAQCLIRIDQPWAEYMRESQWDLSPIHFADALVRADLGLSGVNLEINVGFQPNGSVLRDQLEFSRLLDLWTYLGLPLYVTLTFPTSTDEDKSAFGRGRPVASGNQNVWTPTVQRTWIEKLIPLFLAKRVVHGIFWNQLSDAVPHEFPHGGLFNAEGRPKPALATLASMRKYHLR